jgi:hypothetical protein
MRPARGLSRVESTLWCVHLISWCADLTSQHPAIRVGRLRNGAPSSDEAVEVDEGTGACLLEVAKPAAQHRVKVRDHAREAHIPRAPRLVLDAVLEIVLALLAHQLQASFELVSQAASAGGCVRKFSVSALRPVLPKLGSSSGS